MLERKVSKEVSRIILQNQKQALEKAKHHVNAYGEKNTNLVILRKMETKLQTFFRKLIHFLKTVYHG